MEIDNAESKPYPIKHDVNSGHLPSDSPSFDENNRVTAGTGEIEPSESIKLDKKLNGSMENVGEKVEGDAMNPEPTLSPTSSIPRESSGKSSDDLIRELESRYERKFPKRLRELLQRTALINLGEGRGVTVSDLKSSTVSQDNAEKQIHAAMKAGLLIPLSERIGKMKQYVLANYKHIWDSKAKMKTKEEVLSHDISLLLISYLSEKKYGYHNIHLETSLNYAEEDYQSLEWPIPSQKNKQKVKTFKLENRRNSSLTVSSTGTISIAIESTLFPYELHTVSGLIEFFVSCGQILNILQIETYNRINVVPKVEDWHLRRFDYNKDLSTSELSKENPQSISWSSKGVFKVKYLGTLFQIYCKQIPFTGEHLRFEGHYISKEKLKVKQFVSDISKSEETGIHPFTTLVELLTRGPDSEK